MTACGRPAWVIRLSSVTSAACHSTMPHWRHCSRLQTPCPSPTTVNPSAASTRATCRPMNPYAPVTSTGLVTRPPRSSEAVKPARRIQETTQNAQQEIRNHRREGKSKALGNPALHGLHGLRKEIDVGLQGILHP